MTDEREELEQEEVEEQGVPDVKPGPGDPAGHPQEPPDAEPSEYKKGQV